MALTPLMPGQQLGHFGRLHGESLANGSRRGDAAILQVPADRHPEVDRGQLVGVSSAALFGGELGLIR